MPTRGIPDYVAVTLSVPTKGLTLGRLRGLVDAAEAANMLSYTPVYVGNNPDDSLSEEMIEIVKPSESDV